MGWRDKDEDISEDKIADEKKDQDLGKDANDR